MQDAAAAFFQMAKFCERDPVHAGIYRIFKMNGIDLCRRQGVPAEQRVGQTRSP